MGHLAILTKKSACFRFYLLAPHVIMQPLQFGINAQYVQQHDYQMTQLIQDYPFLISYKGAI